MSISIQDMKDLAALRREEIQAGEEVTRCTDALNATQEAKNLTAVIEKRKSIRENITTLEDMIRTSALSEYRETNAKPTLAGLVVKNFKVLKYNKPDAETWAKENMPVLFKFDEKSFEKYAKAVAEITPVPCVTIEDDPRVEIASDLNAYLGE